MLDDSVEQRQDVLRRLLVVEAHPTLLGRTIEGCEIELVFGRVEGEHKVEHHFLHLIGAAVGFINLVDDHYRLKSHFYGLLKHEAGLRHRPFERVDEQQTAVGHIEHSLNLAAEISVTRGVYDVDFIVFVIDRYVLGENCDTTLALKVVIIEDELTGVLVLAKEIAGEKHLVYQRCFAVVDVRDDGDVANFLHSTLGRQLLVMKLKSGIRK